MVREVVVWGFPYLFSIILPSTFIDADKPPYVEYFQWALRHVRRGALIIADNVIREGKVLNADSTDEKVRGVQRFNKMLAEQTGITATLLPTIGIKGYEGMVLIRVNEV